MRLSVSCLWAGLLACFLCPERAFAVVVPVYYRTGDMITPLAALPDDCPLKKAASAKGENPTHIGVKHYLFDVYRIPVWTTLATGEYVAYSDDGKGGWRYLSLGTDADRVSAVTGISPSHLQVPWHWKQPWGLYLLGAVFGCCLVSSLQGSWRKKQERNRVEQLLADPRYQPAIAVLQSCDAWQAAAGPSGVSPQDQAEAQAQCLAAFEAGVVHLVKAGVPREEAQQHLLLIMKARPSP